MKVTDRWILALAILTTVGGLVLVEVCPATRWFVIVFVPFVLVCCIGWCLYELYRRLNLAGQTVIYISICVGLGALAAAWLVADIWSLWTLLCITIASGAANVRYAIHLKRAGAIQ